MYGQEVSRIVDASVVDSSLPGVKRRALDLFCGTGSVGKELKEMGWEVVSLDKNRNSHATLKLDIMKWDFKRAFKPGYFDIICASVPCTEYTGQKRWEIVI